MHRHISSPNQTPDNDRNRSQDSFASTVPSYVSHVGGGIPRNEQVSGNASLTLAYHIDRNRNQHSYAADVLSPPPSYVSNIGSDRHEMESDRGSGISSAPSVSDSGTLADDTDSSLADTDVLLRSDGRGTSPPDLQYGKFLLVPYVLLE
jgi:hypothetical protein